MLGKMRPSTGSHKCLFWAIVLAIHHVAATRTPAPTPPPSPTPPPPPTPAPTAPADYDPGNLQVYEEDIDIYLSKGLTARVIARSGEPVPYSNGSQSTESFHLNPDGAAVFENESTGGWVYVSNSETDEHNGGVGGLYFDKDGNLIEYKMLLTGTNRNCNGGKTFWGAWISCEEDYDSVGQAWQVDPFGIREPVAITHGSTGGAWESFALDARDSTKYYAFLTEDIERGAVQRMTLEKPDTSNPWEILLQNGTVDYLLLEPNCDNNGGTFQWITDEETARQNAADVYPTCEGMEMDGNILRVISKARYGFFHLNLDAGTYVFESTQFAGQPDQSTTVYQEDGSKLIYFSEEADPIRGCFGAQVGIHTRNEAGEYTNILFGEERSPETTGIAFSPDGMYMYFAYQQDGLVMEVSRTDGLSLFGRTASPADPCTAERVQNALSSAWQSFRGWMLP